MKQLQRAYAVMQLRIMTAILISLGQDYAPTLTERKAYGDILALVQQVQTHVEILKESD